MMKNKILFLLCIHKSSRSQMAEGLLRQLAADRFHVCSAGVEPTYVRPEAVTVMAELGIDISQQHSKSVDVFEGEEFDYAITVCDSMNEGCPVFPGSARCLHWSFPDPAAVEGTEEERLVAFRQVRDSIKARLQTFVIEKSLYRSAALG